MRGISISELGAIDVMKLVTNIPKPTPNGKQVLINVKYAGVNPVDTYIRSGAYGKAIPELPFTPGYDGSGIVQQIGDQVTQVKEGDRVWFAKGLTGSSAEFCLCNEEAVGGLPDESSFELGAMVGTPYMTAYRAIFQKAQVKKGETVLIHGATGGVGNACVQICKNVGCRVIGTAGSTEGAEMLVKLGVDVVFNHRTAGYIDEITKSGEKIKVIVEMLANVNLQSDLELIEPDGRIAIVGNRGTIEINPRLMMKGETTITGVMAGRITPEESLQCKDYIKQGLQAGWIKPVLWKALNLQHIGQAHEEIIINSGAKDIENNKKPELISGMIPNRGGNRHYVIAFICIVVAFRLGIEIGRSWPDFPCTGGAVATTPEPYKVVYPIAKPASYTNRNRAINFRKESLKDLKDLKLIHNNISRSNIKAAPPPTTPSYVQIKQADSMGAGDFNCGGTVVERSCAYYVKDLIKAKELCDSFSGHCKGFVFNAMPPSATKDVQFLIFLKKRVDKMTVNIMMDFYVKSQYMSEIGWRYDN